MINGGSGILSSDDVKNCKYMFGGRGGRTCYIAGSNIRSLTFGVGGGDKSIKTDKRWIDRCVRRFRSGA